MTKFGYNVLAMILVICATILSAIALVMKLDTVEVIAIANTMLGVAGTVIGRDSKSFMSNADTSDE